MRGLTGGLRHRLGRAERDRIGGDAGFWRRAAEQAPRRQAGGLGLEIEQRAVERIAGGAGRHGGLQRVPVEAICEPGPQRRQRGRRGLGRFAITGVGRAFATAGMAAANDLGHHGHGLGPGAPADCEMAGNRPMLDADRQVCRMAGSHFKV